MVTVVSLFLLNKNRVIKLANFIVDLIKKVYNRLKIQPTFWHPMTEFPKAEDSRNIIDVRIRNIDDENAEEVIAYFDVTMQRYYDYSMYPINFRFMWRYDI